MGIIIMSDASGCPKVAVIGVGYWGRKHVEEYKALGADVTAVDLSDENLKFCAKSYGVKTAKDYRSVLSDPDITAVSICTPNALHYRLAKECLDAGKNVLVEKPLAMAVDEGRELIDISKDKGLVLAVGHIFRFNNAIRKVKEMIEKYELGEIRAVQLKWTNMEPLFNDRDVIFDLAPHPFDIINFLFKKNPNNISCIGNAYRRSKSKGVELAFINCMLGEIVISIELSWLTPPKTRSLVVVGSSKSAIVNCTAQAVTVVEGAKSYNLEIVPNNTISTELETFLGCAGNQNKQNISDGAVGLDIVKMIEICQKSLKEGRVLNFEWR